MADNANSDRTIDGGDSWRGSRHNVPQTLTRPRTRRWQVQAAQVGAQVEAPLAPLALVPRQELAQLAVVEALPRALAVSLTLTHISPGCHVRNWPSSPS